jgi:signal transduction histidine kinase
VASTGQDYASSVQPSRAKPLKSGELQIVRDDLSGLLAHDLKTPLAAISMNLDFALSELDPETPEGLRAALSDCRQANVRAIRIVSDMADAVRLIVGERRPILGEVPLGSVVAGVVERALEDADGRSVRIVSSVDDAVVLAHVELLARALDRLVERALRHARASSQVAIEQRAGSVAIRVRTMTDGSTELGARTLATYFAEAALRAQGGTVWTDTDVAGDLVYRVALPRA